MRNNKFGKMLILISLIFLSLNSLAQSSAHISINKDSIINYSEPVKTTKDYKHWFENVSTCFRLFAEWILWIGPEEHVYINDRVAFAMSNSRISNEARDYWYNKVNSGEKKITDSLTNFRGKKRFGGGNYGFGGIFKAGIDPIEQYVGSTADYKIISDGCFLTHIITNITSFKSLAIQIIPEFLNLNNTRQTFIFTELIDCSRIKE